jgi:tetratricopeptide (TPR) repeat protein
LPPQQQRIPIPRDETDFEDWCVKIYARKLNCPNLKRTGRRGQKQGGVDLLGNDADGKLISVQSKSRTQTALSQADIDSDVAKAIDAHPDLTRLLFVTTQPRDVKLHAYVLGVDRSHFKKELFSVDIEFWESIEEYLNEETDLQAELCGGMSNSGVTTVVDRIERMESNLNTRIASAGGDGEGETEWDKEIDEAFEYAKKGKPDETITRLSVMKDQKWGRLSEKLRFRVLANIGNAYAAKSDFKKASELYLEARKFWDSPSSRILEARAWDFRGDKAKALALIETLLEQDQTNCSAHAQRLHFTTDSYNVALKRIPPECSDHEEVSLALSYMALDEGELEKAETHARNAPKASPDWNVASTNLAAIILMQSKAAATIDNSGELVLSNREGAIEAEQLLTVTLSCESLVDGYETGMVYFNRAGARRMLGMKVEAREDLDAALRLLPNDRQILATFAANLDADGNHPEALRLLRKATSLPGDGLGSEMLLALWLQRRGDEDSMNEALEALQSAEKRATAATPEERFEYARFLCRIRWEVRPESYSNVNLPSTAVHSILSPEGAQILDASWLCELGHEDDALETLALIKESAAKKLLFSEAMEMAALFVRMKQPILALDVLEPHISESVFNQQMSLYLQAATSAGAHVVVLKHCKAMRQNYVRNRGVLFYEANALLTYESRSAAIELFKDWLEKDPEDIETWINIGIAAIDDGQEDIVLEALNHLPEPQEISREHLERAFRLVFRSTARTPEQKLEFAYRLWRHHRKDHLSWIALSMAAMVPYGGKAPQMGSPEVVASGSVVLLKIPNDKEPIAVCIEDGPDPDASWDEFASSHPKAMAVLGKRVGEEVELPGSLMAITHEIVRIIPKEIFASNRCLNEFEKNFPDVPFVQSFNVPHLSEQPTAEEIRSAYKPMIRNAAGRRDYVDAAFESYSESSMPTWVLAHLLGISHFDSMDAVLELPALGLRCLRDPDINVPKQTRLAREHKACVLSVSALVILAKLDLLEIALKSIKVLCPRRLIDDLENMLMTSLDADRSGGVFMEHDGNPVVIPPNPDAIRDRRSFWERMLGQLKRDAVIVNGLALAEIEPAVRKKMEYESIGPADSRSIAIAKQLRIPFLTDEHCVAEFAQAQFGVSRLSSVGLLAYFRMLDIVDEDTGNQSIAKLVGWRVSSVTVSAAAIVAALKLSDWSVTNSPAQEAVEVLAVPGSDRMATARLLLETVRLMWRAVPAGVDPSVVLLGVLKILERRRDGRQIGQLVLNSLESAFGVDVFAAKDAATTIAAWLSTDLPTTGPGGIILPWG